MRKSPRILILLVFLVLVALMFFAPTRLLRGTEFLLTTASWPFLKVGAFTHARLISTARFFVDHQRLRSQNTQLEKQVEELGAQQIQSAQVQQENQRLAKLLDFRASQHPDAVAARVIGYDPSGWVQSILIDKGSRHGLEPNLAVVCPTGVVGKVVEVQPLLSKVLLLVDSRIRIGAMLEQSRDVGILEGDTRRLCRLLYLPKDSTVVLGQQVLTSGLGGIFPKGILIGKVVGVGLDDLALYQIAQVQPAMSLSRLEEVLVLKPKG